MIVKKFNFKGLLGRKNNLIRKGVLNRVKIRENRAQFHCHGVNPKHPPDTWTFRSK